MAKTIYLNLEDDVPKVVAKLKRETASDLVLVFPKQSYVFSDSINLRLLKKQIDLLGKKVSILTMDQKGKMYAEEAGFTIKRMPARVRASSLSDIRPRTAPKPRSVASAEKALAREAKAAPASAAANSTTKRAARSTSTTAAGARLSSSTRSKVKRISAAPTATSKSTRDHAEEYFAPIEAQDNVFLPPSAKMMKPPKRRRSLRPYVIGFVVLVLITVLLLVLVVLPSASITVFAKSQTVARDLDVIADTKATELQTSNLTMPAVAVNEAKTLQDNFQVNGKKELGSKAEGRVAIYNLTGQPLTLKAATTTLKVGDKSYVFKADQPNIRALTSSSDTNATLADIVATDGGESYNVPAGTRMEITNQAFGTQPQRLYAKTVTQVLGGNSRFVSVLTKEDFDNAQKELLKRMVDEINGNLANQNVKLVDGAYTVNVQSFTPEKPEGTEATTFAAQLQATITGLAFDETALKQAIRQRILSTLGSNRNLQDVSADTIIYKINNLDTTNGVMQLSIHYESSAKPTLDAGELRNKIAGKSKQEASDLILTNPDVDRVEITVQPTWQTGLPRFASKIHLEVK